MSNRHAGARQTALPAVRNAIPFDKELVASFNRVALTAPVWNASLKVAR